MREMKKHTRKSIVVFLLLISFGIIFPGIIGNTIVKASTIKLDRTKMTLCIYDGFNTVGFLELNGVSSTDKVVWSSSNKSIATVNQSGKVTAKKIGNAVIKAKVNNRTYNCTVNVTNMNPYLVAAYGYRAIQEIATNPSGVKINSACMKQYSTGYTCLCLDATYKLNGKTVRRYVNVEPNSDKSDVSLNVYSKTSSYNIITATTYKVDVYNEGSKRKTLSVSQIKKYYSKVKNANVKIGKYYYNFCE